MPPCWVTPSATAPMSGWSWAVGPAAEELPRRVVTPALTQAWANPASEKSVKADQYPLPVISSKWPSTAA